MRLKSLKIQGFKSFADTIELDFSDGITAVVGPNGSGKSNISDAVRWVLGEQSAKTLRGSKMEDVIFNGTEQRKRLGFAEVTLKLDNHDRHFNLDFDEISITRKVFASCEGQYFINGTPCRLKDIHEVFMDTGLGRDGYSMVGQGKIDEILSNKSEDRREIFEEAAGISRYRYRKEEAERRLKHTDENLDRVADIITELETQLGPLTQQAEKAKKYLNYKDELKLYEVNAALSVITKSREQRSVIDEKIDAVTAQLLSVEQQLTEADAAQEACYAKFEELDAQIMSEEDARKNAEEGVVLSEREIDVLKSTIDGNIKLLERIEQEVSELIAGRKASEQALVQEINHEKELAAERSALVAEKAELGEKLANFDQNQDFNTDELDGLRQEIASAFERISENKIKLSNFELIESNQKSRNQALKQELAQKEAELSEHNEKSGSISSDLLEKEKELFNLEALLSTRQREEIELTDRLALQKQQVEQARAEVNQEKTRLHLLSEMEQNYEGYYKSVRQIMKEHEEGKLSGVHGPVSKLLQIDKAYAAAIGSALGGAVQNIVVNSEEDAKKAINSLKRTGAGRATFMPLSAVNGTGLDVSKISKEPGYIGLASELCRFDAQYENIVQNLLGKTIVIETVDQAISVSRKFKQTLRIVTLEGESFYPGGAMSGGSQQKGNQLLSREQEINDLKSALSTSQHQLDVAEKEYNAIESQILDIAQVQEEIRSNYVEVKEQLLVLSRDQEHQGVLLSALKASIDEIKKAIEDNQQTVEDISVQRSLAADALEASESEIQAKRQKVNELEQVYESFANRKQDLSDLILEKSFEETAKNREIELTKEKINHIQEEIHQAETFIALRNSEIAEIHKTNEEHSNSSVQKAEQRELLKLEVNMRSETIKKLGEERQKSEQKLRSLQGNANNTREIVYQLKTENSRLVAQRERLDTEADNAISRLWDEYELTYSEAENMKQDMGSETSISKQISILRGKIRDLGNVNVDAIEELKVVEERYTFLTNQRDDLQKAKRDLLHIISEMQTIMKKQFKEQFEKISQHFKSTFSELFGGGRADLRLEDEENVLECGIEINVQPPGKKLQSLSLLSGGERALSAIALLFAILRIKPTPFCFLDEIEAALDENNVYRYAEFIKRFSRNTQFILITHRRGTMESADVIYGVTMQEKGVSKLLKLNLDEIK